MNCCLGTSAQQENSRSAGALQHSSRQEAYPAAQAEAQLAANLALLQQAHEATDDKRNMPDESDSNMFGIVEGSGAKAAPPRWVPPQDQTGDGRTRLNDLLGY